MQARRYAFQVAGVDRVIFFSGVVRRNQKTKTHLVGFAGFDQKRNNKNTNSHCFGDQHLSLSLPPNTDRSYGIRFHQVNVILSWNGNANANAVREREREKERDK